MGTKSWNVKLLVDRPELRSVLDRNLAIWNDGSRQICLSLLALRRGIPGSPARNAWEYIAAKSGNWHLVYWLSEKPKPTKESEDVQLKVRLAQAFIETNGGFDRRLVEARQNLGVHWTQAIKASIERVKSYEAKLKIWSDDHKEWLERRAKWEADNADYMRLRQLVVEFQRAAGATRGSRVRWHKWLEFLRSTPAIIQWRNPQTAFVPLSDEELNYYRLEAGRFEDFVSYGLKSFAHEGRNLSHQVPDPSPHRTRQDRLTVFRDPHKMVLDVEATMRSGSVVLHPSILATKQEPKGFA